MNEWDLFDIMDHIETGYRLRALETPKSQHHWAPFAAAAACFVLFSGITAACLFGLRHHEISNQQSCSAEITEVAVTTESTAAVQTQTTVITVTTTTTAASTESRLPESTEADANASEWLLVETQIPEDAAIGTELTSVKPQFTTMTAEAIKETALEYEDEDLDRDGMLTYADVAVCLNEWSENHQMIAGQPIGQIYNDLMILLTLRKYCGFTDLSMADYRAERAKYKALIDEDALNLREADPAYQELMRIYEMFYQMQQDNAKSEQEAIQEQIAKIRSLEFEREDEIP